jgi:hypothetical protein
MPHESFPDHFPEIAKHETRGISVPFDGMLGLPMGQYIFLEQYCTETDCDCRNVYIVILNAASGDICATITYGWEPYEFYTKWMGDDAKEVIEMFKGPALPFWGKQSADSRHWLKIFTDMIESDAAYRETLIRHYGIMKDAVAQGKIKAAE